MYTLGQVKTVIAQFKGECPPEELLRFMKFMKGQTAGVIDHGIEPEESGYYKHDVALFLAELPVVD